MPVTVRIPTALRTYTEEQAKVQVDATTVDEAIASLVHRHGDLREHLLDDGGAVRGFVNLYVNQEDVKHLQDGDTPLEDGDTLVIIPAVAGGSR